MSENVSELTQNNNIRWAQFIGHNIIKNVTITFGTSNPADSENKFDELFNELLKTKENPYKNLIGDLDIDK
jgi:hypothetical protein